MPNIKKLSQKNKKTKDVTKIKHFLEELSWLLSSYSNLDFKHISKLLSNDLVAPDIDNIKKDNSMHVYWNDYLHNSPNTTILVGILPRIFSNLDLFSNNQDIVDFSRNALNINIPRWNKKSRNEIIGDIVCKSINLKENNLDALVNALSKIVSDEEYTKKAIKSVKSDKLEWSTLIRQLYSE